MLIIQVRWVVFLAGAGNRIYSSVCARCGCKIWVVEDAPLAAAWQQDLQEDLADGIRSSVRKRSCHWPGRESEIQAWPWPCRAADLLTASWIASDRRGRTSSSHHSATPAGLVLARCQWGSQAQRRLSRHTLNACNRFHRLNLPTKITAGETQKPLVLPTLVVFT